MTLFIGYTILMTVLNIINGILTYRIFKQLEMGVDMGKNKKSLNKEKELNSNITVAEDSKEEFDGSFSNPFADSELDYLIRQSSPKSVEGLLENVSIEAGNVLLNTDPNNGNVNIPIITDEYDFPEDDEKMLNRLLFLSDYLNGKYKPSSNISEQEFEDMKWETANETYCLITIDLPRKKAEVVRKYFRRLDTTYARRDGTYYSKVLKGELAKEVIDDLIEVYPWYEEHKPKIKVEWDKFRKSNTNEINISPGVHFPPANTDDYVYKDRIKYAIGNLGRSVEKLNEILAGK